MENPTCIKVNNKVYLINTDFRTWINFERLWFDEFVTAEAKTAHIFKMVFPENSPPVSIDSFNVLVEFYICSRRNFNKSKENTDVVYDFKIDRQKIKASFMTKFGFNPWELKYYHWWDFKACFDSLLGADFENLIKARSIDLSEFKGKHLREMTEIKNANKLWTKRQMAERKIQEKAEADFKAAYASGDISKYK